MAFSRSHIDHADDQETLSAYLDNQLNVAERTALERRLQADQQLQSELQELRVVKALLSDVQPLVPPRSFTLDPSTVRKPAGLPLFNLLRLGSSLATVLLVLTFTVDFIRTSGGANPEMSAASAPAGAAAPAAPPASSFSANEGLAPTVGAAFGTTAAPAAAAPAASNDGEPAAGASGSAAESALPTAAASQDSAAVQQRKAEPTAASASAASADSSTPPEVVQPGALRSSGSSSPGTGESALPSESQTVTESREAPSTVLRWVEVVFGIAAIALALGAWVAWRQGR